MELSYRNYHFDIKTGKINCIIGKGIDLEELLDSCQELDDIAILIHPVINQILYKSVKEELESSFELSNHTKNNIVLDALKLVNLNKSYLSRRIDTLSCSEIYLIKLASILILNPRIIILDSPNIYLDSKKLNNFLKIIRTIKKRYKKTIIIFSNDSNFIHTVSDYIFVINEKEILDRGNKYEIFTNNKILKNCQIELPKIIELEQKVLINKNINIGLRDNINDLIKDIYYNK